jgi:hypothetical protein
MIVFIIYSALPCEAFFLTFSAPRRPIPRVTAAIMEGNRSRRKLSFLFFAQIGRT